MRRLRMVMTLGVALALVATACSGGDSTATSEQVADADAEEPANGSDASDTPVEEPTEDESGAPEAAGSDDLGTLVADAPAGADFYMPPDPVPGEPGDLIWAREYGPLAGGTGWLILYHSTSTLGEPVAVSGLVVVPAGEAPEGGRPVMSWGHGTRGIADQCALTHSEDPAEAIPILDGLIDRGVVVVATDYEGLGTPGRHPYVMGESEAHGMLDAIRATQQLTPAAANDVALLGGQSQGGHAMAFANELADDYAPELNIVGALGTSAGVISADDGIIGFLISEPEYHSIMVMAMAAQQEAWGNEIAPPTRLLTDLGLSELDKVDELCADELSEYFSQFASEELFRSDWDMTLTNGENATVLNEPGHQAGTAPLFLIHTRDDALIPAGFVATYLETACEWGVPIEIEWWDGGHGLIYASAEAQDRVLTWIDDRLAGVEPVDVCGAIPRP